MPYKIILLGPESTGKTTLSRKLAKYFNTIWLPEYGRYYLEKYGPAYTYKDVVKIAKIQYLREKKYIKFANKFFFVDTDMINIEVWFEVVFNKKPLWLPAKVQESLGDFYLLCKPDIEWKPDRVRENSGSKRWELFEIYKQKIISYNRLYTIIEGIGNIRFQNCVNSLKIFENFVNYD